VGAGWAAASPAKAARARTTARLGSRMRGIIAARTARGRAYSRRFGDKNRRPTIGTTNLCGSLRIARRRG
jgi:hypothetical protein